jgi:RNA polymerase sigma-70 factor (ECF subfamily)
LNTADADSSALNALTHKEVSQQIDKLEQEYKQPFEMHFQGFKYKEIADSLDIPIGTVKSRIFIARKKLMDFLPDYKYRNN